MPSGLSKPQDVFLSSSDPCGPCRKGSLGEGQLSLQEGQERPNPPGFACQTESCVIWPWGQGNPSRLWSKR